MANGKIELSVTGEGDVAYLSLSQHPGKGSSGIVKETVQLRDLIKYEGADIYLDFDSAGRLSGLEILG